MGCDPYQEYILQRTLPSYQCQTWKKRALIAVAHSQLTAVCLILSTGARYHELGAQYMQAKIEKKRKLYLTAEMKKLGYKVSFGKKSKQQNLETTLS